MTSKLLSSHSYYENSESFSVAQSLVSIMNHNFIIGNYRSTDPDKIFILDIEQGKVKYVHSSPTETLQSKDSIIKATSDQNSINLLIRSLKNSQYIYSVVKLKSIENDLYIQKNWPIITNDEIKDIASIKDTGNVVVCGDFTPSHNQQVFLAMFDSLGTIIISTTISHNIFNLHCDSITYGSNGVIVSVTYINDDRKYVVLPIYFYQFNLQANSIPLGFKYEENQVC